MDSFWVRTGAVVMALGVIIGAFGAHGLKDVLSEPMKAVYETGVRYHLIHGLAFFVVAWLTTRTPSSLVPLAGYLILAGIILFSGSLYALALTRIKAFGIITPFGGMCFIAGWFCLIFY